MNPTHCNWSQVGRAAEAYGNSMLALCWRRFFLKIRKLQGLDSRSLECFCLYSAKGSPAALEGRVNSFHVMILRYGLIY